MYYALQAAIERGRDESLVRMRAERLTSSARVLYFPSKFFWVVLSDC